MGGIETPELDYVAFFEKLSPPRVSEDASAPERSR
jgi:hypothetical protein